MLKEFPHYHYDSPVKDAHVQSLVEFFQSGCVTRDNYGIGVEIEHLPVRVGTDEAVGYTDEHGIRDVLHDLAPLYDESREYYEDGHLLGLGRGKIAVSLEPGAQIECSLGVLDSPEELNDVYAQFRRDINPILEKYGIRLINYGYTPRSRAHDLSVIPKRRYDVMTAYLGRLSAYGWNMMRASASTQISLDFSSEADAIAKMRMGTAVGPILAYLFRNTPYFEGAANGLPLLRQHMWEGIGTGRTGVIPGLYDSNFDFEKAAVNVLATPLMVADTTHTPEAGEGSVYMASYETAADVYPDRALNVYEMNHIISTQFTDVRLKNFVELRHWDSLSIDRARVLADIVVSLFNRADEMERLKTYFDGLTALDVQAAKYELQTQGRNAKPYGASLDFWREFLHAEYTGEDIPGDQLNLEVGQE